MNAMQLALVKAGLSEEPKQHKKKKTRTFDCYKCHSHGSMVPIEGTNTMVCQECGNYFIFTKGNNEY